jgi:hypothetical protein
MWFNRSRIPDEILEYLRRFLLGERECGCNV